MRTIQSGFGHATMTLALMCASVAASAQQQIPQPGQETPRADVAKKAPGAGAVSQGPGTQTEDDIYIGRKLSGGAVARPVAKTVVTTPPTTPAQQGVPLQRNPKLLASPGTKGAIKPPAGQRTRATGDEDEMDDLDIQRRKAQGLPDNKPASPKGGVGAGGESPQTERR